MLGLIDYTIKSLKMSSKNLIICSGDSFTAGDELAGDYFVPGYTSHLYPDGQPMDKKRSRIVDKLMFHTNKLYFDHNLKTKYENLCKEKAWPSYLEKILNDTDVINCAGAGISNAEISHRTIENFCRYKNEYKNISIILMATTYNRMGYPMYDKQYRHDYEYISYTSLHYQNKIHPDYMHNDVHNFLFKMKDYDRLIQSISVLSFTKLFFESNQIKITFIDSSLWDQGFFGEFDADHKEKVSLIKKIIPISATMSDFVIDKVLPGFHYTEQTHKDFADHISKLI